MQANQALNRLAVLALAAALLLAAAPMALGAHQQVKVPPPSTGLGETDVRDEPNHPCDTPTGDGCDYAPPGSGFDEKVSRHDYFSPTDHALVLESYYVYNVQQVDADVNNVLNHALYGDAYRDHRYMMYPGYGYFGAYWGWWFDKDGDGVIADGHDDPATAPDRTGPWDEFVWRGNNPWAPLHGFDPHNDTMHLFVHPGTWATSSEQTEEGWLLRNDHDARWTPDAQYQDHTHYGPYSQRPLPQDGGWVGAGGYPHINYDASLLITVEATTAVNANPNGDGTYDAADATAVDTDTYLAVSPALEEAYRTAIWDPGDHESSPGDALHPEGPKQLAKDLFTALQRSSENALVEAQDALTRPATGFHGPADDTVAGARPHTHEPNTPQDAYNGWATHDPATRYGAPAGPYYDPGPGQAYAGYADDEHAWLDAHTGYSAPAYAVLFPFPVSANAKPAPNLDDPWTQTHQNTAAPGFLYVTGHFGTWWDANGDTFVGDLGEEGRLTSPDDPYRQGTVDDPNDYTDHPGGTASDPAKAPPAEWRGLCNGGADLRVTLTPLTPGRQWTGGGVYVVGDDSGGYNPYDDAVADALGSGPWGDRPGDGPRHVTAGNVTLTMSCYTKTANEGWWYGDRYVLLPTGSLLHDVRVTTEAVVLEDRASQRSGAPLRGEGVVDVDVVHGWT